jgi:hypothetical protein
VVGKVPWVGERAVIVDGKRDVIVVRRRAVIVVGKKTWAWAKKG